MASRSTISKSSLPRLHVRTGCRAGGVLFPYQQECSNGCHADRDGRTILCALGLQDKATCDNSHALLNKCLKEKCGLPPV